MRLLKSGKWKACGPYINQIGKYLRCIFETQLPIYYRLTKDEGQYEKCRQG